MDIGMLQLGVRQARFALPTAVVFSGVFTCQVLGMRPSQSEGSCSLMALEELGVGHTTCGSVAQVFCRARVMMKSSHTEAVRCACARSFPTSTGMTKRPS